MVLGEISGKQCPKLSSYMRLPTSLQSKIYHGRKKTVYEQHRRYFHSKVECQCPIQLSGDDLVKSIGYYKKEGEETTPLVNISGNTNRAKLCEKLTRINTKYTVIEQKIMKVPVAHFREKTSTGYGNQKI